MADEIKKMVGFKRGPQANLDALLSIVNKTDIGTFYLTTDTNRLYIRGEDGYIRPVNAGILTVDQVNTEEGKTSLPVATTTAQKKELMGKFYYAVKENVLCIHNGEKWIQINAVVKNTDFATTVSDVTSDDESLSTSILNAITDSEHTELSGTFNLKTTKINKNKTIDLAVEHNTVKVGEKDVVVSDIILSGDVYSLQSPVVSADGTTAEVELLSDFEHSSTMQFGSDGSIKFEKSGERINIKGFAADQENTLTASPYASGTGFEVVFTDHNNTQSSAIVDPKIVVGVGNASTEDVKFANGTATLPVYTSGEVNSLIANVQNDFEGKLKAFNAMEYKGTVGSNTGASKTALPTEGVAIGHAYLASSDITVNGTAHTKGTLFVAVAKDGAVEDSNGFLPSTDIEWTSISGAATDTRYSLAKDDNIFGLELMASTGSGAGYFKLENTDVNGGLKFKHSNDSQDNDIIIEIGHNGVSTGVTSNSKVAQTEQTDLVITYVNSITQDSYGHVTGFTTQEATIKDTKVSLKTLAIGVAQNGTNKVDITPSAELEDAAGTITTAGTIGAFSISSSSLEVNTDGTDISMNLVWGSF